MRLPRLLLLTDRAQLPPGRDLVETVSRCVDAGLSAVVVRELDLDLGERHDLVAAIAGLGVRVMAARRWCTAAHGIHLAADQPGADAVQAPFHGRSCHDGKEVVRAVEGGASYVTLSPVAVTASKPGYGPPVGTRGVRRAADLAGKVPVFALGGVDVGNAAAMRAAGAHGVAVMGAVMRAEDPAVVVARIQEEVR